jgi:hypothetical protein
MLERLRGDDSADALKQLALRRGVTHLVLPVTMMVVSGEVEQLYEDDDYRVYLLKWRSLP